MIQKIKEFLGSENFETFVPLVLISIVAVLSTVFGIIELSSFAIGLAKYTLAVAAAWFVDNKLFPNVNTVEVVSSDPKAYAIFWAANLGTAAWCLATS